MDLLPMRSKSKVRNNMKSSQEISTRRDLHKGIIEDAPTSRRLLYRRKNPQTLSDIKAVNSSTSRCSSDFIHNCSMKTETRLMSGYHNPCIINIIPQIDCNIETVEPVKPSENIIMPSVIHIALSETHTDSFKQRYLRCLYMSEKRRPRKITRGTQTLYRESSMQTLPYLPDVSNDKEALKELEVFKLSKLLKGEGPPGLWEVEILERARKRWTVEKSLNEKFQCAMKKAREDIGRKRKIPQHKAILEAFEWEDWLEREERIQGCQMLRFQLVLRIFEKRQREMHNASDIRIQKCCEQIVQKRDHELKKNEIEFGRELRRLKIKHEKKPRNWRKEKISNQLGDPSSEYYAPQMRYGVNPNRRHFQLSRKAFEMRMEDLEKRAVNMRNLECPFAKLKEWSKPKEQKHEVEQNFCTETNLQKLYEGLKNLREQSKKQKIIPKCLVEKTVKSVMEEELLLSEEYIVEELETVQEENSSVEMFEEEVQAGSSYSQDSLIEMYSQRNNQTFSVAEMLAERRNEELENMLAEYEGKGIGWLLRFLAEERSRLLEQRKLHFITMLAQKERWRREAAEAGLRQKENEMRNIYEQVFNETEKANTEVCEQYLDNIFGIDTQEQADFDAICNITDLARTIDIDLQRWLTSFQEIQNPINYYDLRCLLRDLVFPDNIAECLVQKYETKSIIDYIINDVLFEKVYELLEPIDVACSITNNFVDRLIDTDLYVFSTECSSGCDCEDECSCQQAELESKAILRKIVRYSVPGRRWRTSTERIADENVNDIFDDVCGVAEKSTRCTFKPGSLKRNLGSVKKINSKLDLFSTSNLEANENGSGIFETTTGTSATDQITVVSYSKPKQRTESKRISLVGVEKLLWEDESNSSNVQLTSIQDLYVHGSTAESLTRPGTLTKAMSTYDMSRQVNTQEKEDLQSNSTSSDYEDERFHKTSYRKSTSIKDEEISQTFLAGVISEVIKTIVPANEDKSDIDSEKLTKLSGAKSVIALGLRQIPNDLSDENESSQTETSDFECGNVDIENEGKDSDLIQSSDEPCEEELIREVSEYKMVMYEGELKKILSSDEDECLCQEEIDHRNYIRQLYKNGQIKLIYKDRTTEEKEDIIFENETEQTEKEIALAELTFEYVTSMDEKSFAVYHDEGVDEAGELVEKLTILEHEIEDNDDKEKDAKMEEQFAEPVAAEESPAAAPPPVIDVEEQPAVDTAEAVPTEESPEAAPLTEEQPAVDSAEAVDTEKSPEVAPLTEEQPVVDTAEAVATEESPVADPLAEEQPAIDTAEHVATEETPEAAPLTEEQLAVETEETAVAEDSPAAAPEEQPAVDETAIEAT